MRYIQQSFTVKYDYKVYFTSGLFSQNNTLLSSFFGEFNTDNQNRKVLFVVDSGVLSAHPYLKDSIKEYFAVNNQVQLISHIVEVAGGEACKQNNEPVHVILEAVNEYRIDRHSFLAVIGGGAVLDMAGYAAAIAHRGIKLIRIPTTVLSQNDSGVGVKNSINYFNKKNFLGTFSPPVAVFNDEHFLHTLDDRNWRSGIAEAIKVALIKDGEFFGWIENNTAALNNRDSEVMEKLIFKCAKLHMEHIAGGDPFESGSSRPLDFGHWNAHKIEQLTHYDLLHGEAVAIGIALDTIYSFLDGYLDEAKMTRVINVLLALGFDLNHPVLRLSDKIMDGLDEFREHLGGRLTIMLLKDIGEGMNVHNIDKAKFQQAVQTLALFNKMILK